MQLKEYQNEAIRKLLNRSKEQLKKNGSRKIVFKSPTASGKTIMTAEFLKQFVSEVQNLSFVWVAPRKLHTQSKKKLERYHQSSGVIECSEFEDLLDNKISENEILFLNWESINKEDNIIVEENEQEFYLDKVIEKTKEEGREIILIIDESHHHATSDISLRLINDVFQPKLAIDISATPTMALSDVDEQVQVDREDVKREGMIKKSIVCNQGFKNELSSKGSKFKTAASDGTNAMILEAALEKRSELIEAYNREGRDINPLLLIQLPNRKNEMFRDYDELINEITETLKKNNVQEEKIGKYLNDDRKYLENITENTNEVEVLIFKQAIALGWDCPRAHILVTFREYKSTIFSVQTLGRIMRVPEPNIGHYDEEILNHAYVYTNLSNIDIQEDVGSDYLTIYTSNRIKEYKDRYPNGVKLKSFHRIRQRERTRLTPSFIEIFLETARKNGLKNKINIKNQKVDNKLVSDVEINDIDIPFTKSDAGGPETIVSFNIENERDLQRIFDYFSRDVLLPDFYPEQRSIGRIKESIYRFFKEELKMSIEDDKFIDIVSIVLSAENRLKFIDTIEEAKAKYKAEVTKKEAQIEENDWEIPIYIPFGPDSSLLKVQLSVMKPFYHHKLSKPEEKFIEFLEQSQNVDWWFRNGERDKTYFSVPYTENQEKKLFYVDFIIMLKNGKVCLFDTKQGLTLRESGPKSDGLKDYIKKYKNVNGGIIANTQPDLSGSWKYYKGKGSDINDDLNNANWHTLEDF
tara:strand:- start:240 stop:2489 length:2250 start_codon:yes stop_codon:yes gene_type:complete